MQSPAAGPPVLPDVLQSKILQLHNMQQQLALAHGMALADDQQSRSSGGSALQATNQGSVLPGASMRELLPHVSAAGSVMPAAASLHSPGELQQQLMQVRGAPGHLWSLLAPGPLHLERECLPAAAAAAREEPSPLAVRTPAGICRRPSTAAQVGGQCRAPGRAGLPAQLPGAAGQP
jgi:hypothetical protein